MELAKWRLVEEGGSGRGRQITLGTCNPTFTSRKGVDVLDIWGEPGNTGTLPATGAFPCHPDPMNWAGGCKHFWEEMLPLWFSDLFQGLLLCCFLIMRMPTIQNDCPLCAFQSSIVMGSWRLCLKSFPMTYVAVHSSLIWGILLFY